MKRLLLAVVLIGVFVIATLVTAFALTLSAPTLKPAGFVESLLSNAMQYGWAAGISVTAVFALLRHKIINRRPASVIPPRGPSDVNSL